MTLEAQIRERVAAIPEPCSLALKANMTLGSMGLIEDVAVDDGHVTVTLCLTDAGCVHFAAMQRYVADVLHDLPEVTSVTTVQTTTALWTPDRIAAS